MSRAAEEFIGPGARSRHLLRARRELAGRGDFGIGTLNGCDGEMIAIDGSFLHADTEGRVEAVDPEAKTPFAVLATFEARHRLPLGAEGGINFEAICAEIDERVGHPEIVHAVRVDATFDRLHLRSIPRVRSGDGLAIAAYLGRSDAFDRAILAFPAAYADQNERDYEAFRAAIGSGRLEAATAF